MKDNEGTVGKPDVDGELVARLQDRQLELEKLQQQNEKLLAKNASLEASLNDKRNLFEIAPVAMLVIDEKYRIVKFNSLALDKLVKVSTADSFYQVSFDRLLAKETRPYFYRAITQLKNDRANNYQWNGSFSDKGTEFESNIVKISDGDAPLRFLVKIDSRVSRFESILPRSAMSNSTVPFAILDEHDQILDANPAFCMLVERGLRSLMGSSVKELFKTKLSISDWVDKYGSERFTGFRAVVNLLNSQRQVNFSVSELDSETTVRHFLIEATPVQETTSIVDSFLQMCPLPVLLTDREGRVLDTNAPARALLSLQENWDSALTLFDVISFDEGMDVQSLLNVRTAPAHAEGMNATDESKIELMSRYVGEINDQDVLWITLAGLDCFAESLYHKLFIKDRSQQVSLDVQMGPKRFLSMLSHGLRTSCASSTMLLKSAMEQGKVDSETGQTLLDLNGQLFSVLDDLRFIVNPDAISEPKYELASPVAMVRRMLKLLNPLLEDKKITFTVESDNESSEKYWFDSRNLRQLLYDLINNVSEHSGASELEISVSVNECSDKVSELCIVMSDNGKGIPAELAEQIFEPGYRGNTSQQGAGLGLYTCRQLTEGMGGSLVYKDLEPGSCFIATVRVDHEYHERLSLSQMPPLLEGKRVLLAEDERIIRMITERMLQELGADVTVAENGEEALQLFSENHFDLLITDYQMPVMNGDILTQKIRLHSPTMQIIAITAASSHEDTEMLKQAGVDAVLVKPVNIEDLMLSYSSIS